MTDTDPLVTTEWLRANLQAPKLKVVDGTWIPDWVAPHGTARSNFLQKHIPSSVYFDIDEICDKNSTLPHMLPSEKVFSKEVGKLGISNDDLVIVYDANNYMASARVWWMFRAMGHENVQVLDGGLSSWLKTNEDSVEHGRRQITPCNFIARSMPHLTTDTESVSHTSRKNQGSHTHILDARPSGRFQGSKPEPRENLPSGHIPNSTNIPHDKVIDSAGLIRKSNELQKIFNQVAEKSICTCGSGVSAAVLALALARLGKFDVSVYDGSWCAWAQNSEHPIATGLP